MKSLEQVVDSWQSKQSHPTEGSLRVWWCPQVPCNTFFVSVATKEEGERICEVLASYDMFQLVNRIKPDYCNTGGIQVFEDGEWLDCEDEDEDE